MILCFFDAEDTAQCILDRFSDKGKIIAVFGENAKAVRLAGNTVAIASADNEKLLTELSKTCAEVIVCKGAKATITYSSNSEDNIVVSLQRRIYTVDGEVCEPFDIPIEKKDGISDYSAMALVAVLAKLGIVDTDGYLS